MSLRVPKGAQPIVDFTIQIVVGTLGFLIVFLAAVGLAATTHAVAVRLGSPVWIITTAETAERVLFVLDLFSFGLFLLAETLKLVRSIWQEVRHG